MNWDAIGAIGEALGAAGVIVSLLYLALQIRGDARARRAATVHQQSEAFREFLQLLATTPDLAEIYMRGVRDVDALSDEEFVRFASHIQVLLRFYEETFFELREGHLDPEIWEGLRAPIEDLLAYPGVQEMWKRRQHFFSPTFRKFIEDKLASPRERRLYREPSV